MNDRLPSIPTPPAQRWRLLRQQYVPGATFAVALLAAATLWTQWVAPPTLVGEAEAIRTELRSVQPGTLARLDVDLLQPVSAGQTLGYVFVSRPEVLEASLALIRAEIELMRATLDPVMGQQRAALDFDRLQLDWMSKRVELASLQGELHQNESTLVRSTRLHQAKMITDEEHDLVRNARDTISAQVKAQSELIAQLEPRISHFHGSDTPLATDATNGLKAAINHKTQELRLIEAELGPVPLIAPIDGVITQILRRSGEAVGTAEPILQISATRSERIIGFLRQPVAIEPKPGMIVEVRTRNQQRQIGTAHIAQVGQQLEPISPSILAMMRLPVTAIPTEFGIRVLVSAPTGLALRPGEPVDLILRD
jgi:multidrug resistance efflux pump